MKIAAIVVLYNPSNKIKDNILSYLNNIDKLYVIDNTVNKNNESLLPKSKKIKYISNNKNLGIASALNMGAKEALKDGYHWMLTMDQDSKFKGNNLQGMIDWLDNNNQPNIGLISPWHSLNITKYKTSESLEYVDSVMTSGNIINLDAYKHIGGFKDWLFIDGVDFEYCFNLKLNNYSVIRLNQYELIHGLGNIVTEKFLFKNITHSNHNYIRRYYITRNYLYLNNIYKNNFKNNCKDIMKEVKRDVIKVLLLEKDKYKKIRSMIRGYLDYKKGIKGEYRYKD